MEAENTKDFFNDVQKLGNTFYNNFSKDIIDKMNNWSNAYNTANALEINNTNKTFLFSAQHKDCIILATIMTALSNSNTIIWRTDTNNNIKDKINNKEDAQTTDNMSASLSLLDWNYSESANTVLFMNLDSSIPKTACVLDKNIPTYLSKIVKKYKNTLSNRYLCVYEFNDTQLQNYVRLSQAFGIVVKTNDMKAQINDIKKEYNTKCNLYNAADNTDCSTYLSNQDIQSRILVTKPSSSDPYVTHILGPNDNKS